MSLFNEKESKQDQVNSDFNYEEEYDMATAAHKIDVRRKLEQRLDRKRLKEELEDYEGEIDDEFDWSTIE